MEKVFSLVPESVIKRYASEFPSEFEIEYVRYNPKIDELSEALKGAKYLIASPMHDINRDLIERLPDLKIIQSSGVGFDKFDLEAAKENNIFVANCSRVNKNSVAEHILRLALSSIVRLVELDEEVKAGKFDSIQKEYYSKDHFELDSMTVGVVGLGNIGKRFVELLEPFAGDVLYNNTSGPKDDVEAEKVRWADLDEIYENADIITYTLPVTPDTKGMVNTENIAKMKDDVIIINVSRGQIINSQDLADALNDGKLLAGLDVLDAEPPKDDHPLLNLNDEGNRRLIITPHIGGSTNESLTRAINLSLENVRKVIVGERPENVVNGL